jgi:hypothetical protein
MLRVKVQRCEKDEQWKQMSETFVDVLDRVTRGRQIR